MVIQITTKIYSQLVLTAQPIPHQKRQNSSTTEFFCRQTQRQADEQMHNLFGGGNDVTPQPCGV